MSADVVTPGSATATVSTTGESAIRVTGTSGSRETDWLLVHKLARRLTDPLTGTAGVLSAIPTYESVLIEFDAMLTDRHLVADAIRSALPELDLGTPLSEAPRHFVVPVLYGGEGGPDLDDVARLEGMTVAELIAAHTAPRYVIRCLGSPGGSPMLDGPALPVPPPRLRSPRASVPQGAVSLAGRQATITPAVAPGGWSVIGRTPYSVLDLDSEPLVPYGPGDTLGFEQIDADRFEQLRGRRMQPEGGAR